VVEVLERFLTDELGETLDTEWTKAFRDMVRQAFLNLGLADPMDDSDVKALLEKDAPTVKDFDTAKGLFGKVGVARIQDKRARSPESDRSIFRLIRRKDDEEEAQRIVDEIAAPDEILVAYRNVLRSRIMQVLDDKGSKPKSLDALGQSLFIDVQANPCQLTTRATLAIQSLQSLVLAVRGGRLSKLKESRFGRARLALKPVDPDSFDEPTWHWLRSFSSWNAAIYALVYPENLLTPLQTKERSDIYRRAFIRLRGSGASDQAAQELNKEYVERFRALAKIDHIDAHIIDGTLYVFVGSEGRLFFTTTDVSTLLIDTNDEEDAFNYSLQAWTEITGLPKPLKLESVHFYKSEESSGFIAWGIDKDSKNKTYRITTSGDFGGEIEFEASIERNGDDTPSTAQLGSFSVRSKNNDDTTPTLWSRDGERGCWVRAELDMQTGTWGNWGACATPPERGLVKVKDTWCKIGYTSHPLGKPEDPILELSKGSKSEENELTSEWWHRTFLAWNLDAEERWTIAFSIEDGGRLFASAPSEAWRFLPGESPGRGGIIEDLS